MPPESGYLEAAGAAVAARKAGPRAALGPRLLRKASGCWALPEAPPLSRFADRVIRMQEPEDDSTPAGDAISSSEWTQAPPPPRPFSSIGTPAESQRNVICEPTATRYRRRSSASPIWNGRLPGVPHRVVQAAVTGSGREIVSIYLDNCTVFNEILAHARAARELVPDVDTLFEIGGQDAKFVALQAGIPVDYSMNDGCSAGTGSFLEEAAASDMQVPIDQIGSLALSSASPIAFGERCAAFINSEVRAALQQGVPRADVLAGLVYAIVENYLSRVVGARQIGRTVLLQGGVALNPAVAPAVAALAGVKVTVPPNPELMGCEGAARMVGDLLSAGAVPAWDRDLGSFGKMRMETKAPFTCPACDNRCEVQRFSLRRKDSRFWRAVLQMGDGAQAESPASCGRPRPGCPAS